VGELHPRCEIRFRNSSDALVVVDVSGGEWVHKQLMGSNQVLAEAVAFLLANRLSLPVPLGGVAKDSSGAPSWLSAVVPAPSHWHPNLFETMVNGEVTIGTMYALDALVANEDRHDGNLLLEHRGEGVRRPWYIDFANAYIGTPDALMNENHLFVPNPRVAHFRPAPLTDAVIRAAEDAAARAKSIPRECLAADAYEACDAAGCPELEKVLFDVLVLRCSALGAELLPAYLAALEASQ
jgi:hypothetical protein